MNRVGLVRTEGSYRGLAAPFDPGVAYPELASLAERTGESPSTAPNHVYAAVREALRALALDPDRFGTPDWNPLGDFVRPGATIVLKPNFIRHWNPRADDGAADDATIESVITHGSVLRAAADYAMLAAGPDGEVIVAEAPQQDCDFERIRAFAGLDELVAHAEANGHRLSVIDLRREAVVFDGGIIVERKALPGDPLGYRAVDLGRKSFFEGSGLDPNRFRGADYDPGPTAEHHRDGRNEYLLSETVLSSDLIVNLPKLKTHKKTGVTLALKNLVGINGDKNWLPHHSLGAANAGGDEFPEARLIDRLRSRATEIARPLLARGKGKGFFRAVRRVESATRGDAFIRAGNWYGNRTTWRMCCDLNRCLYYSDHTGLDLEMPHPVRTVLTLLDGIVAGEGEGPLAPSDVPLGAIVAGTDPIAVDLVAVRLMGFDYELIPKLREPMKDAGARITRVREPRDVEVAVSGVVNAPVSEAVGPDAGSAITIQELDDIQCTRAFEPHEGWRGHIERAEVNR
ncbi:MAG: DUF362 domain-containing protein [Myxococcota bacterium]|nr:DUF362 domain-containing protein [Myxococcota bacterium]